MRGPGTAKCGYLCAHGPIMAFTGAFRLRQHPEYCIGVGIVPAADSQHGSFDALSSPHISEPCFQ